MNARRTHPLRLALEICLVLAFILILAGGFLAQARSGLGSTNPAPGAEVLATPIPSVQGGLMAAEMAALTPPFYLINLPVVQR